MKRDVLREILWSQEARFCHLMLLSTSSVLLVVFTASTMAVVPFLVILGALTLFDLACCTGHAAHRIRLR